MRVLLINPPAHQLVDEFDSPNFTRLGLACVAGHVLLHSEHEVEILDAKFEKLGFSETVERALRREPDVVGLTALTNEIKPAARIARAIKARAKGVTTVIGGAHVSAIPETTLSEFPCFDLGVVGEGELTFLELLDRLAEGGSLTGVEGLACRSPHGVVLNPPRQTTGSLDLLAEPAWHLLPRAERYLYMSQRGCPFRCSFCQNPNGRAVRSHSIERVVHDLLDLADRFHPREVMICDEIFTVNLERTEALLDLMIAEGVGQRFRWWAQTHVNVATEAVFRKMRRAGCYRVGLGIETGDDEILKSTRKGITKRRVIEVREMARHAGLPVEGLFIIGHPHESWQSAMATIDFAGELNPEVPVFSTMVPYPGTRILELAERGEGGYRLLSRDWNDYLNQVGHSIELEGLSRTQIEVLQLIGYVKVFAVNGRFLDLLAFAHRYRSEGLAVVRKILRRRMPTPHEPEAVGGDVRTL